MGEKEGRKSGFEGVQQGIQETLCMDKVQKNNKEAFYEWSDEARKKRELCLNGGMRLEEFKLWLEE
ncbi:MAG: hypothetical protein HPY66_1514 [Firmicutes bacterium]|nr:hypothetical protein [Bacillota bacterium]